MFILSLSEWNGWLNEWKWVKSIMFVFVVYWFLQLHTLLSSIKNALNPQPRGWAVIDMLPEILEQNNTRDTSILYCQSL